MLSDKFLEKAKNELREDEKRKEQALEHFREWINKHPYIKSIWQGKASFSLSALKEIFQLAFDSPLTFLSPPLPSRWCFSTAILANQKVYHGQGVQDIRELYSRTEEIFEMVWL